MTTIKLMSGVTIGETSFKLPGQTGFYKGKVRDVYTIKNRYLVSVATDRVSAFDVILPRQIPHKGQVLNQLAAYFLEATADIVPNWLISIPDANVSLGYKCQPFKIEMVVRGALVGHAWREYKAGKRQLCGETLPDGMKEYDKFLAPIITPATKASAAHDEDVSPTEIIKRELASKAEFTKLSQLSLALFERGQHMAANRGLYLADTKYEFGKLKDQFYVIDEIHTPDSSRYFYQKGYEDYIAGRAKAPPKHLSKEFVREWLMARNFSGQDGQNIPTMSDKFVNEVASRYQELFSQLTGKPFKVVNSSDNPINRIEKNIRRALAKLP